MSERQTSDTSDRATEQQLDVVAQLCRTAFGPATRLIGDLIDIGDGRGTFAKVFQASLEVGEAEPFSVAVKIPTNGANREAAIKSKAYEREALAYRTLLANSPVRTPEVHLVDEPGDGTCSLVLEDLTPQRAVDQLDGLLADDAAAVLEDLHRFHRHWASDCESVEVRRIALDGFADEALNAGLSVLERQWSNVVTDQQLATFAHLIQIRKQLVTAFEHHEPTLCHGDPRADNLVFADAGPVIFDWQQLAIQHSEADVAWLCATSLETTIRQAEEFALLREIGGDPDRYRLGMALPGLAVLLLAQREIESDRARAFVETSVQRIAAAVDDLELDRLNPEGNLRG